jgi:hypothetical protein
MVRDAVLNLIHCNSGVCFVWHGLLGCGALLLGVWFAYELWCRPYREEARIYTNVLRDRAQLREEQGRAKDSRLDGMKAKMGTVQRIGAGLLQIAADRARRRRLSGRLPDAQGSWGWKAVELALVRPKQESPKVENPEKPEKSE